MHVMLKTNFFLYKFACMSGELSLTVNSKESGSVNDKVLWVQCHLSLQFAPQSIKTVDVLSIVLV